MSQGRVNWRIRGGVRLAATLVAAVAVIALGAGGQDAHLALNSTTPSVYTYGQGTWQLQANGGIVTEGDAPYPSPYPGSGVNYSTSAISGVAAMPSGAGLWTADSTGHVYTWGSAAWLGGATAALTQGAVVVSIASSPSGNGYWLVTQYGQVYSFGDACSDGNAPSGVSNIVAIVAGPPATGYWLVGSDGKVYTPTIGGCQTTPSHGQVSGTLNAPIVGAVHTADYGGYTLAGSDGGVFTFGDANFYGSASATALPSPITGITLTLDGAGYWLTGYDGGILDFGDAYFEGSSAGTAYGTIIGFATS